MSERIIFLDIDGPMIPSTFYLINRACSFERHFPDLTVAALKELCRRTDAKIVFNTTHNNPFEDVPDIDEALVNAGFPREYIRETNFNTVYPRINRMDAINRWLDENGTEDTEWIALDDSRFTEDERLIWIDPDSGLHVGHINRALELWGCSPMIFLL